MKNLKSALSYLFNWKDNPASVFLIAIPLFVFAFGLLWFQAILMYKSNSQIEYIILIAVVTIVMPFLFYPVFRNYKETQEWIKKQKKN